MEVLSTKVPNFFLEKSETISLEPLGPRASPKPRVEESKA